MHLFLTLPPISSIFISVNSKLFKDVKMSTCRTHAKLERPTPRHATGYFPKLFRLCINVTLQLQRRVLVCRVTHGSHGPWYPLLEHLECCECDIPDFLMPCYYTTKTYLSANVISSGGHWTISSRSYTRRRSSEILLMPLLLYDVHASLLELRLFCVLLLLLLS